MKKLTEGKQKKVAAFFEAPFKAVDIEVVFRKTLRRNVEDIRTKQEVQQFDGLDANGLPIQPAYKPSTIAIKKKKGQPTDRVTLKDTGDFYRREFVKFNADHAVIDSRDKKAADLKAKYGEDIFGLNEYSREGLMVWIKWDLQNFFEQALKRGKK